MNADTKISLRADLLGETLRMAIELADEAARCDIESYCAAEHIGLLKWYDTRTALVEYGTEFQAGIDRSLRYLTLRRRVVIHPLQQHLVRFPT